MGQGNKQEGGGELQERAGQHATGGRGELQKGGAVGRKLQEGGSDLLVHRFMHRATRS